MSVALDTSFAFEETPPETTATRDQNHHEISPPAVVQALDAEQLSRAQVAAHVVSYHWDIASDAITWSEGAGDVLGCSPALLSTGKRFADFLDGENFTSRYDTVMRSTARDHEGKGIGYEIEYKFRPEGRGAQKSVWIEDHGRWFGNVELGPQYATGMMTVADARHVRDQELSFLSSCDPLTGLMNRSRMIDALDDAIGVAVSDKLPCAFVVIAVNNLDIMNEAYGFDAADEIIIALAQRLQQVMRVGDGIARYSGSKFGIILNNCKADELNYALERFVRSVRDSVIETRHGPVWALLSMGAVSLPALGDTAAVATAHAEEALSEAFRLPTDGYVIYTSSESRRAKRLLNARCATEIVTCLRDNLFRLAYQPIVDAKSGDILVYEALLRMEDSTGAMITAGHLVPIAERLGLVRLIDRSVLQQALATLQAYPDAKLSVNISATTANDPRWNCQVLDMISEVPALASRLIIEVTETVALGDLAASREFVEGLRKIGCGIALDDFGAGYTSYRNLKELPLTMIKLDGSFCMGLEKHNSNWTFVKSMVGLAHDFGLKIVAEWVETEADAEALRQLGVDYLQGNVFAEPSIELPWRKAETADFQWQDDTPEGAALHPVLAEVPVVVEPIAASDEAPIYVEDGLDVEDSLTLLKATLSSLTSAIRGQDAHANPAVNKMAS